MEGLNTVSYNCRGLPKSKQRLGRRPDIVNLLNNNDIIALQEIWYSKQDLKMIDSFHTDFDGFAPKYLYTYVYT